MQLKQFAILASVLARVSAIPNPNFSNDVDVEARDFSGESLSEFDTRDEEDLEARTYRTTCKGSNVELKYKDYKYTCVCKHAGEVYDSHNGCQCPHGEEYSETYHKCIPTCEYGYTYNDKTGKCEKPFSCKGENYEIVDEYGVKSCKCKRTGEVYDSDKGCQCPHGEEYSEKYYKCIPECKYGEEYNSVSGKCEKPFSCKGKNVEIVDNYGVKSCKCKLTGQVYNKHEGCKCPHGEEYSEKYYKCIPECKYGEEYNDKTGKCEKPFSCKGKNVEIVDEYGVKSCKCKLTGQVYNKHNGCECPHGEEYSEKYYKCIPECKYGEYYNDKTGKCEKPFTCKGKNVEVVDNYGVKSCKCKLSGQVYSEKHGCQCKHGEYFSDKYHKCIPECKYGEEYDGHSCKPKCKGDHVIFKHHECKCLKAGEYYDKSYGCKDRCPNEHDSWNGHKCVCDKGYESRHGKCVKPPACIGYGSYFDKSKWECRCQKHDYKYVEHTGCVKPCGKNSSWNGFKCECNHGYVSRHGQCVKPPTCKGEGSYFDKSKWECKCSKKDYEYTSHGCQKKSGGGYGYGY